MRSKTRWVMAMTWWLCVLTILTVASNSRGQCLPDASVRVVDSDAPGGGGCATVGRSWQNAYKDLQAALDFATTHPEVHEIWVAVHHLPPPDGYKPSKPAQGVFGPETRALTFILLDGVGIYGGFRGWPSGLETQRTQRDPEANDTVLSGVAAVCIPPDPGTCHFCTGPPSTFDCFGPHAGAGCADKCCCDLVCCELPLCCAIAWDDVCADKAHEVCPASDKVYHVVTANGDNTQILDGFTVRDGYADGNHFWFAPGEVEGGGVLINVGQITTPAPGPVIARCRLVSNGARYGGGLFSDAVPMTTQAAILPTLANLEFRYNQALTNHHTGVSGDGGGAYSGAASDELWVNGLFAGNTTTGNGAGLYKGTGTFQNITNCTFADNVAMKSGGGIYLQEGPTPNDSVATKIANCILWDNVDASGAGPGAQIRVLVIGANDVTVSHSDVEGGPPATVIDDVPT